MDKGVKLKYLIQKVKISKNNNQKILKVRPTIKIKSLHYQFPFQINLNSLIWSPNF